MNISQYVKKNFKKLPKSTFDGEEVVIIKEIKNWDGGYGHHSYNGYGVDSKGNLIWCFSSGCSCNGNCGTDHQLSSKAFNTEWTEEFTSIDPEKLDFNSLQVTFNSY